MALTQVKTSGIADDAVTSAKIPNDAIGPTELADDAVTSALIADDAVVQAAIADEAVDEARLQISNTGSNGQFLSKQSGNTGVLTWADGASEGTEVKSTGESGGTKFLREDGDGTSSWQAVPPGTSLTGSTDNTVVTVTGANALAGEANLTFDGSKLHTKSGSSGQSSPVAWGDDLVVEGSGDSGITILSGNDKDGSLIFGDDGDADVARIAYNHTSNYMQFDTNAAKRVDIDSLGATTFQNGHLGSIGGGVVVCAAVSSSGDSADSPNYKVDFTVPCANVSANYNAELKRGFDTGETGKNAELNVTGSGILIATCGGTYYWGFATKIYHLTVYGNGSSNASSLNELHSYSGQGHSSNASHVTLAVQSIAHSTPTIRATFGGDYWNSNRLNVTWIGSAVASPCMIRPNAMTGTHGHANWTGQDPTWK